MPAVIFSKYTNFDRGSQEQELYDRGFYSSDHFLSSADEGLRDGPVQKKKKFRKTKRSVMKESIHYDLFDDEESGEYFKELFETKYQSVFTDIVTGKVQITEEDEALVEVFEREMFENRSEEKRRKFYNPDTWSPMRRYGRITSNIQNSLHRVYGKDHVELFFLELENFLEDFILKEKGRTVISFKDPYQRFLAHGVFSYYLIHAKSVDFEGKRITVLQRSTRLKRLQAYSKLHPSIAKDLVLPKFRLYKYIGLLFKHNPEQIERHSSRYRSEKYEGSFDLPDLAATDLEVSDLESGFDSTSSHVARRPKKKVLRKRMHK